MKDENFLDSILIEIGEFGKYQKRTCFYILILVILSYFGSYMYVFEAKQVNHRCKIEKCDSNVTDYKPWWWKNAIPSINEEPSKCAKFRRQNNNNTCYASDFDASIQESCNDFVYETAEISILHDFNLQCEENIWKMTLVGTLHGAGLFIGLPITGMLSDRFGRKIILISTMIMSGTIGIIRTFSVSYMMFLVLEVLESVLRAGVYAISYILAVELVVPKKRVLVGVLVTGLYSFGGVVQGSLAWYLLSWKMLARILYALYFIPIVYYWLIPESVRWLLAKRRFSEARGILEKVATVNGKLISEDSLKMLEMSSTSLDSTKPKNLLTDFFLSKVLIVRVIVCCTCWMCCILVYNGLTVNAVALSENSYFDFILVNIVEIPSSIPAYLLMDRAGRKITLIGGYLLSGLSSFGSIFISKDLYWLKLTMYLLSKFVISVNLFVIYAQTSELFPTTHRNSLLSTCSMFGRIGTMLAPQMPLLSVLWKPLPSIVFGCAALLAAFLTLFLPESRNTKLPCTIKEAENIGKQNETENSDHIICRF